MTDADGADLADAFARLTVLAPELSLADDALVADWAPETPPPTTRFGALATAMVDAAGTLGLEQVRSIFDTVEDLLTTGPDSVQTAVATGFLEQLMAEVHAGRVDIATVAEFLGPASYEYCDAWETFVRDGSVD